MTDDKTAIWGNWFQFVYGGTGDSGFEDNILDEISNGMECSWRAKAAAFDYNV